MNEPLSQIALELLQFGSKGAMDHRDGLMRIEESLTSEQYKECDAFINWLEENGKGHAEPVTMTQNPEAPSTFGWNLAEVYAAYRASLNLPEPDPYPHHCEIAWGHTIPMDDPDKIIESYSFATEAELSAFLMGVECAAGWYGYEITKDSRYE